MPSYTSIINSLLRLLPGDKRTDAVKSVTKLHPNSENLSDLSLASLQLDEHTRAWQTRHAFEACRGWKWPFWINAQTNPVYPASLGAAMGPTLANVISRDAAVIPGLPHTFTGTMDRRGMVTVSGARFSLECWFRFGDAVVYPSEIFSEDDIEFTLTPSGVLFTFTTGRERLTISAGARESDDLQFIELKASCESVSDEPPRPVTVYVSIRPYSLEGVAPLHDLVYNSKGFWMSESHVVVWFPSRPSESWAGDARHGDAAFFLSHPPERTAVRCPAGLATAVSAFHFPAEAAGDRAVNVIIPTEPTIPRSFPFVELVGRKSSTVSEGYKCSPLSQAISVSNNHWGMLLSAANHQLSCLTDIRSREMHSQFLHHNHWLVAAVRALLYQGHRDQASRLLQYPALSIQKNGYLGLGCGKWGFQGQFLTALADYYRLTQTPANDTILNYRQIRTVARWIMRKRREIAHAPTKPTGLLPPGVTRSGTGMEYQLADNFWALEGLESAAWLARHFDEHSDAELFKRDAVRYASQINGAIHRELEYGLSQQVPGRLHRAFDPASAAELLDIALMPHAYRHLRADDWLSRLITRLISPLPVPGEPADTLPVILREIDTQGVYPARRLMLCLAMLTITDESFSPLLDEAVRLATPQHSWPQRMDLRTCTGTGQVVIDPESTALFTGLIRQLLIQDADHAVRLFPALTESLISGDATIDIVNSPTESGAISAGLRYDQEQAILDLQTSVNDPTVELYWCRPEPGARATFPCHHSVSLGSGKQASGRHTHKFPQPSNNPTS